MDARNFSPSPLKVRPGRQGFNLKRWYRGKRDISTWDGVRRDVDLFEDSADCSVFLYLKGQSQRGPAFRLSSDRLRDAKCDTLLSNAHRTSSGSNSSAEHLEIYLPAPAGLLREDALKCHIATRNFFAWLCRRPLVGQYLGMAMADLLDSMNTWRSSSVDNVEDVLIYADRMGYSTVEHRPDNALAMLAFAEKARVRHVWIDSFAHCTGMNAEIGRSSEFEPISRATKALITRSFLEMDLHLDRASRALVGFLENELSAAYLGLSDGARHHLDTFRTFLQTFYVGRFGYWPPYSPTNFPKDLYYDMYDDFSCLYDLLADKDSTDAGLSVTSTNGGICVQQNVDAFNVRHKYNPLPYSQPLVPRPATRERSKSRSNLRSFKFGRDNSAPPSSKKDWIKASLREATNRDSEAVTQSGLVQQYLAWEDDYASRPESNVSISDARKVRWILIYGLLQTLVSAIQAPAEVRDTTTAAYPLCILTDGLPPWDDAASIDDRQRHQPSAAEESEPPSATEATHPGQPELPTPTFSIHPDCEQDYFEHLSGRNGSMESQETPQKATTFKRAGSRLRKASIKRKSLQSTKLKLNTQPELVSGRTLAELAYGDHSISSADHSPVITGFDFGFDKDSIGPDSRCSVDSISTVSMSDAHRQSTFDDFHNSISHQTPTYPVGEADDGASIPSLTHSHGSRETVNSVSSDQLPNSRRSRSDSDQTTTASDYFDKDVDVGLIAGMKPHCNHALDDKVIEATTSEPASSHVTRGFTDFFAKTDYGDTGSDESSLIDYVDRAAVIDNDGNFDQDIIDSYRSMAVS